MMTKRDEEIEQFPVQKRQIRYEAEPEMIFFDVDEDPGEADFIRVDDLFQLESQAETSEERSAARTSAENPPARAESPEETPSAIPAQQPSRENSQSHVEVTAGGAKWFTLFPQKKDLYIDSRMSRMLRRTLLLTAYRLEKPIEKIRIRPQFIQWFMELSPNDDMEAIIQECRDALELQAQNLLTVNLKGLFLSDTCMIQPAEKELSVNATIRAVSSYQEGPERKGTQK